MSAFVRKVGLGVAAVALVGVALLLTFKAYDAPDDDPITARELALSQGIERAQQEQSLAVRPHPTPPPAATIAPREPVFSPDGRYVACRQPGFRNGLPDEVRIFEARTGKGTTSAPIRGETAVEMFWHETQYLSLAGTWGETWQVKEGRAFPDQLFASPQRFVMPVKSFSYLAPSTDTKSMETTPDVAVLVTNIAPQHRLGVRMLADLRDEMEQARFVEVFDTQTGQRKALFQPENYSPSDVSPFVWSPTGSAQLLVSEAISNFELHVSLWDARAGKILWKAKLDGFNVGLKWTPDARYIVASRVTGSRGRDPYPQHTSLVLDARSGHEVRKLKAQNSLLGTAVSNRYLASFGFEKKPGQNFYSRSWALTDLRTGKRTLRCWAKASPRRVEELAFSPDGQLIAGTSGAGLMVWKVAELRKGNDKPLLVSRAPRLMY